MKTQTRRNPDYGGSLPDSIHDPDAPAQTQQEYILSRIDHYKNKEHLSDMMTVTQLLCSQLVSSGRNGWLWLKRWYEEKQHLTEKTCHALMDEDAKSINKINQRLKEFDR